MQTPRVLLPLSGLAAACLIVSILGCSGATGVEDVVPPLTEAPVPVAMDTAAAAAPGEEAPNEAAPDGATASEEGEDAGEDDGVAAADPERQRRRRAGAPKPSPKPEAAPEPPAGEGEEAPAEGEPKKKGAKKPPAPPPTGITQVDATTWHVTQKLVDRWHDDPYKLGNVRESGAGWELIGVRQRNAYHLGMRNFDIVLEVNGRKLNTMPQLLAAYMALKNQKSFDVVFLRSGNRKVHHYEIVN